MILFLLLMLFRFFFIITILIFVFIRPAYSQYTLSGKILNERTKEPVEFAVIANTDNGLWAISNNKGFFSILLPVQKNTLIISCLGFAKTTTVIAFHSKSLSNQIYYLKENNLSLKEVVITAKKKEEEITTAYTIDRNALTHAQMNDISDLMTQLPGGQTNSETSITSKQQIILRGESSDIDNPAIGTAIEVDGVRLSSNSHFSYSSDGSDGIEGLDIRNIAVNNIESVEVITGLPSVENGDLTAGLIKINTRKGKAPYEIEVVTKPKIKSYSVTKGFDLGPKRGTLNASLEYTRSISERVSPYTTYTRNNMSLTYCNTFGKKGQPIDLSYGLTSNFGGYNSESDPDMFVGTYKKRNDYVVRTNLNIKWLLNLPFLTEIDFSTSVNYSDRKKEEKDKKDKSASSASIHSTVEGYYISQDYDEKPDAEVITIPASDSYFEIEYDDDKPVTYSAKLKANWFHKKGEINNKLKIGGEFTYSGNYGRGIYYDDMRYAPEWREFRYDEQPFIKTYSLFAEDKISFPVWDKQMEIQAGVRSDITAIKGSEYGVAQGLSPRVNARYQLYQNNNTLLKNVKLHVGWGDAIKLPTSNVLYPRPSYADLLTFKTSANESGTEQIYAYYTIPQTTIYNEDLKWQRRRKLELGADFKLGKTKVSLTAYRDKTFHPFQKDGTYEPITYNFTDGTNIESSIPDKNRVYCIDQTTGVITISDKTGTYASETLSYTTKERFDKKSYYSNGSPVIRKGLEWIVDFGKIKALKTSVRIDGSYYHYKGVNETLIEYTTPGNLSSDGSGSYYKYVGIYVGGDAVSNGTETKKINANVTLITHIPAIRMVVSCRLESCLYNYMQRLSEYSKGTRSYVLDNANSYFPSDDNGSIYKGNHYVITYPLYYKSMDDMDTQIPFLEKFTWAKENDEGLYNDLAKLVERSYNDYYFKANKYTPYFSANINLTKEIGKHLSITFKATNFFNNVSRIESSQTGNESSLYNNSMIASFYYGMSMKLKL